jgi:hypothetical protein
MKKIYLLVALALFAGTAFSADIKVSDVPKLRTASDSLAFLGTYIVGGVYKTRLVTFKDVVRLVTQADSGLTNGYSTGLGLRPAVAGIKRWHVANATLRSSNTGAYKWKKVAVTDQLTEQTIVTAAGELVIGNLDSGQSALPAFSGTVKVTVESQYQERVGYISTAPTVSGGNVTFGLTLSPAGNNASDGAVYYDITIEQM